MGALEPGFMSFTPIPMSSTGAGANFNWFPFTLMSFTEWDLPCVTSGFVVHWFVLAFELELLTELALGLVAGFELEPELVQFTVPPEIELELEFASCVGFAAATGCGMDGLERGFGFGFIELATGTMTAAGWSSDSRPTSNSTESGDTGGTLDDFANVAS